MPWRCKEELFFNFVSTTAYTRTLVAIASIMRQFQSTILIVIAISSAQGQVVNTVSPDRTNMYFHGLDSVVKLAKMTTGIRRVLVRGDQVTIDHFPDNVDGTVLIKKFAGTDIEKIKLKDGDVVITVRPVSIVRDQFTIAFLGATKGGRLGDGLFIFYYKYIPETQTYELRKIKKGVVL
jgi:hypothetical protein